MRIHWKIVAKTGLWLTLASLLGAGCGGFSGTQSVSPATFLLPGLIQAHPAPLPEPGAPPPELTNNLVAQLR